ncbi:MULTISPECIES: NmrA family NAD(P)-binding protein [Hymenobacter]|uniref:NmrA family NAD(P)-binding protein n=1 Tax=Hymenobacter TaxID=89966 RepID=UPI001058B662|nr:MULTISPECIES: NmrA family NAD(P)-binding protein [Hymenobacter]QIL78266.1 NmrA family NAD(P)-binding protein [Hymenobacter sp. HDW8]
MHIILGATGHIGSALAHLLLARGEPVTLVLHTPDHAPHWQQHGAQTVVADVHDTSALHAIFRQGQRLFLLNPPAPPATDTAAEERKSLAAILAALPDSGLHKVVAESTYGAQPGTQAGDLGVLYAMEQALAAQPIPTSIIRAAYYMSNWDPALASARQAGTVPSLYPADFQLPMVAPVDIARIAARLLTEPLSQTGLHYVEGPARYCAAEVAAALTDVLHRPVTVEVTPRAEWTQALQAVGFSAPAAESMAHMTGITLDQQYELPPHPIRGTTTLHAYFHQLVHQHSER